MQRLPSLYHFSVNGEILMNEAQKRRLELLREEYTPPLDIATNTVPTAKIRTGDFGSC
jgi:hypothetical protein